MDGQASIYLEHCTAVRNFTITELRQLGILNRPFGECNALAFRNCKQMACCVNDYAFQIIGSVRKLKVFS